MKTLTETQKNYLAREITILGEENVTKLINASVTVVGLGGVGGYVCEMLARAGVGRMVIIDCDTVSESNLNRQIIALTSTIGMKKTELIKSRIQDINPFCQVDAIDVFVTKDNAKEILEKTKTEIIVDAIDNVTAKIALIENAQNQGKYIFSAMGTGNKINSKGFKITDISKTSVCGLAKAVRVQLRNKGIKHVDVIFSEEVPAKVGSRTPASICYMPSTAGILIAEHIIKKIISGNTGN